MVAWWYNRQAIQILSCHAISNRPDLLYTMLKPETTVCVRQRWVNQQSKTKNWKSNKGGLIVCLRKSSFSQLHSTTSFISWRLTLTKTTTCLTLTLTLTTDPNTARIFCFQNTYFRKIYQPSPINWSRVWNMSLKIISHINTHTHSVPAQSISTGCLLLLVCWLSHKSYTVHLKTLMQVLGCIMLSGVQLPIVPVERWPTCMMLCNTGIFWKHSGLTGFCGTTLVRLP